MTQHTFEQTVLAYLDGMLDRREEDAFLKVVARDPEKRAMLEQYRTLHHTLEKQRSSYLPAHTERALAGRIPALRNIPLLEDAPLVHASKGLRSLMSIRRISVVLIVGAALFTLLSVLRETGLSPEASVNSAKTSTILSRSEASARNGRTDTNAGGIASSAHSIDSKKADEHAAARDGQITSPIQEAALQHSVNRHGNTAEARTHQPGEPIENPVIGTSGSRPGLSAHAGMTATFASSNSLDGGVALRGIALFPRANPGEITIREHPSDVARTLFGRKLQVCFESGGEMREMIRDNQRVGSGYNAQYLVGLRWEFDPYMAAGLEFGQSALAREGQTGRTSTMAGSPDIDVIIVENVFVEEGRSWVRAHLFYTLNPGDLIQFQSTAGAGLLLGSDQNIMFSFGAAVQYPLLSSLYIRAGLHYSGTWLDASGKSPVSPAGGSGPVAYKFPTENPGRMYNSSIQFRIGAGYLLW